MMKIRISISVLLLVCAGVLTPSVLPLLREEGTRKQPRRLYKVHSGEQKNGEDKVGFIDDSGRLVIGFDRLPSDTKFVGEFHDGRAVIFLKKEGDAQSKEDKDYVAGYIDETGKVTIEPRFDYASDFSEGLAYVAQDVGSGSFINTQGQTVVKLEEGVVPLLDWYAAGFHEGLAAVRTPQGVGFIDRRGKMLFKGYAAAARFSEGLAAVVLGNGRSAKYGFVNAKGEMIIAPRFDPVFSHHNQVEALSLFSEGLASVKVGDLYGYVNKRGDFIVRPQFIRADDFSEGLASVRLGDKMGYIDKSGRWVIGPRAAPDQGGSFKEGLAPAAFETERGFKWGYIDRRGMVVIEPRFDGAREFIGGYAAVYEVRTPHSSEGSRWGYIDKTGKYLWEPKSGPLVRMDASPFLQYVTYGE